MAAGLIEAMRFSGAPEDLFSEVLEAITGQANPGTWFGRMIWQEKNPQIKPHSSCIDFKRDLFPQIDPNFDVFLRKEYLRPECMKIRLEEIT
jgi:hypothetical protein